MALLTSTLQFRPVRSCCVPALVPEALLVNPTCRWVGRDLAAIATRKLYAPPSVPALITSLPKAGGIAYDVVTTVRFISRFVFGGGVTLDP